MKSIFKRINSISKPIYSMKRSMIFLSMLPIFLLNPFNQISSQNVEYHELDPQDQADFSRWLGWVWGDGNPIDVTDTTGVKYTGPNQEPFNGRYDEFVDRLATSDLGMVLGNGGTNTRRILEPWDFWVNAIPGGNPNDPQLLRDAVRNPNFLAGIIDTEGGNCGSSNSYYIDDHFFAPSHPDQDLGWGLRNYRPGRMIQLFHLLGSTYGFSKTSMQVGTQGTRYVYGDEFERDTAIMKVIEGYNSTKLINEAATNNDEAQTKRVRIYIDNEDWATIRSYGFWNSPKRYPDCNNPVVSLADNFCLTNLPLAYPTPNPNAIPVTEVDCFNEISSETSGLANIFNTSNGYFELWSASDYGNLDEVYGFQIDDLSDIKTTISVGEDFIDWEDMATDEFNNIYLADFGNYVSQDDLQIVKIPDPNTYNNIPPNTDIIKYEYPINGITDSEALIHFNNNLYIFTKAVDPNVNPSLDENFTYCYKIPDTPAAAGGEHTAALQGSQQVIFSGEESSHFQITAADISPDNRILILMSYERIWIFSCFENDDFFSGTVSEFEIPYRHYEGVSFINNHEIVFSKEGEIDDPHNDPKLFYLDLFPWIDDSCKDCNKIHNGDFDQQDFAWTHFLFDNADATFTTTNGQIEIDIHTLGTSQWHINLRQRSVVLENGKTYQISYDAYADDNRSISVVANNSQGNGGYYFKSQQITTTPTSYMHEFTMDEDTDFNSYISFNVGTQLAHKVYFDNISLEEVDCNCPEDRYFYADINNTTEHFESSNNIYGSNVINGNSIIYDAANQIILDAGFKVSLGATFQAYIDGCGGN